MGERKEKRGEKSQEATREIRGRETRDQERQRMQQRAMSERQRGGRTEEELMRKRGRHVNIHD